jgi:thiol:disulfide interchange protein DsbD
MQRLAATDRPVMLDFYADWCVSCKEMERFTFSDARVARRRCGKASTLLQADVTANSDADKALLKRFGLFGPPGIIFFDAAGAERKNLRVVGYQPADRFINVVNGALGG